jgi:hypothetical protein
VVDDALEDRQRPYPHDVLEHATALADAIDEVLPRWVERCVRARLAHPRPEDDEAMADAAARARAEVGGAIRTLLLTDVDEQRANPLALLRTAVAYPTAVLRDAGVPPAERDAFSRSRFPDDDYDLTPATWSDVDPALADLGITWGAAKAFEHKQRHR